MYKTYVLFSKTCNQFYVGFTGDEMSERLRKHNCNHKGFTGKALDWEVIWMEEWEEESKARARELEIKGWKSKKKIEKLVEGNKKQ